MMPSRRGWKALPLLCLVYHVVAQSSSCANSIEPTNSIQPSIASNYEYAVVATGLTRPRSLEFDSVGNLLVLQSGVGLSTHQIEDNGGTCLSVGEGRLLIDDTELSHGLALSDDGRTIYVSNSNEVHAYSYNPDDSSVAPDPQVVVTGMEGDGHVTRTLLISRVTPGQLVISRGSTSNVDSLASDIDTGVSTIKSFNLLDSIPEGGFQHNSSGVLLGWGLRNDVGMAEHPYTGGIWAVENSVDQLERDNEDVHADNPGEELNFLGYLNGTSSEEQGSNFGYPECFSAWVPQDLPGNSNLRIGSPFATSEADDERCANTTAPRLTWQAHTAPLDIKFNDSARESWVSLHGSWNRENPVGYSVVRIAWSNETGEPQEPRDSDQSAIAVLSNMDNSNCPDNCLRPVGMVVDDQGRILLTSDASGEIYVIRRTGPVADEGSSDDSDSDNEGSGSTSFAKMQAVLSLGIACSLWLMI